MDPHTPLSLSASTTFAPSSVTCKLKASPTAEYRNTTPPNTRPGQGKEPSSFTPNTNQNQRSQYSQHQELLQQHQLQQKRQQSYQNQPVLKAQPDQSLYVKKSRGTHTVQISASPIIVPMQPSVSRQTTRKSSPIHPPIPVATNQGMQTRGLEKEDGMLSSGFQRQHHNTQAKKVNPKKPKLDDEARKIQALWRGYRCRRNLRLVMREYANILREIEGRSADVYNSLGKSYSWPIQRATTSRQTPGQTQMAAQNHIYHTERNSRAQQENRPDTNYLSEPSPAEENYGCQSDAEKAYRIEKLQREMEWAKKTLQARKEYLARCRQAATSSQKSQSQTNPSATPRIQQNAPEMIPSRYRTNTRLAPSEV